MEKLNNRYNIVSVFIVIVLICMVFQLANLQIINGEKYEELSQQKILKDRRVVAPRGNIFDRNGIPIAINRMSYIVEITKTSLKDQELNMMLFDLIKIFNKNNDEWVNNLKNYLTMEPFDWGRLIKGKEKQLKRWKEDMTGGDEKLMKKLNTPEDMFRFLRDKFNIDEKYTDIEAYNIMSIRYEILIRGYTMVAALTIAKDVDKLTIAEIEEKGHLFPGVATNVEPMRKYLDAESVAHVLGYVANVSSEEYNELKGKGYYMTDYIGKIGIEASAEDELRGEDGEKKIEGDIWGKQTQELHIEPAVPGNDITLTIDMKLQKVAMKSLKNTIDEIRNSDDGFFTNYHDTYYGAAVAIDVNSGEILAMASYPSYDPSIYLADANDEKAQAAKLALFDKDNKTTSSLNRAISGTYPPGSIYKVCVGIAGLEEGVIKPNTLINDPGVYYIEGRGMMCASFAAGGAAHGSINVADALKVSCNVFFYRLGIQVGIDKIDKWAKAFGLGEYVGTEISEGVEKKGYRSNPESHDIFADINPKDGKADYKWGQQMTAMSSIGQGYNAFSPLQLAIYVSTIASGGKKYQPHLIKKISSFDGENVKNTKIEYKDLKFKKETKDVIKEGMRRVTQVAGGTAYRYFIDYPYQVAAKTGTAEGAKNESGMATMIAYTPIDKPKIAIAVVIDHGVSGSYCSPIVKDVFSEYYKINEDKSIEEVIYRDEFVYTR